MIRHEACFLMRGRSGLGRTSVRSSRLGFGHRRASSGMCFAAAEGLSTRAIARDLGTMPRTVSHWRIRFAEEGLSGLDDRPRPGGRASAKYDETTDRRILAAPAERPVIPRDIRFKEGRDHVPASCCGMRRSGRHGLRQELHRRLRAAPAVRHVQRRERHLHNAERAEDHRRVDVAHVRDPKRLAFVRAEPAA